VQTERRAHPRFPLILAVQYQGAENVLDYTEDLSAGGLFICTEREFEVVELLVEVIRHRRASEGAPAGVAVRVPEDRPADRKRLAEVSEQLVGSRPDLPVHRVLLVEDNALVASMYSAALRRLSETEDLSGLAIEVAGDGSAALQRLLRPPRIDVLVTDVFMPVLSGISLVEKIRADPLLADLPVVVITSGGERERDKVSKLGVSFFLRKPVSYQELAGAVRSLLLRRRLRIARAPGT